MFKLVVKERKLVTLGPWAEDAHTFTVVTYSPAARVNSLRYNGVKYEERKKTEDPK